VAEHKQLTRPPLREALIDLRLGEELPLSTISEMGNHQLPDFEPPVQMWRGKITFPVAPPKLPPPPIAQERDEPFGWRYATAGGSRIVQLRRDGLTFSVLQGYTNWAETKASAHAVWQQYCDWGRPAQVARVAVRYINVLTVPVGADFDVYLSAGPRVPPGAPNALSGFLNRVVIPFPQEKTWAVVTQALEQSKDPSVSAVILDIDVWRESRYPADSGDIWITLDSLRDIKNRIFFGSVTEIALEPYR
jgi:uncharacterized protein (TIGR04255 family)